MQKYRVFATVSVLALLAAVIFAQGQSGKMNPHGGGMGGAMGQPSPHGGGMGAMTPEQQKQMEEGHRQMLQAYQQMIDKIRKTDEELEKKINAMNAATGEAKVNAIADVLNFLHQERKQQHEEILQRAMMGMGMSGNAPTTGTSPHAGQANP